MSDVKPPVTEIVSFPVIKGLKPGEGQEKMFGVDAGEGFQSGHYGFEVEDESIFHWALNWDSHDAHVKMIDDPQYKPFIGKILEWSSGPTFYHAALKPHPPTPVFMSPMAEVAKFSVAATREEWAVLYEKFEKGLKNAPGYKAHSAGWTIEDEKDFVLAIGWESVEAHTSWAKTESGVESIKYLVSGAGGGPSSMFHIRLGGAVTSNPK